MPTPKGRKTAAEKRAEAAERASVEATVATDAAADDIPDEVVHDAAEAAADAAAEVISGASSDRPVAEDGSGVEPNDTTIDEPGGWFASHTTPPPE